MAGLDINDFSSPDETRRPDPTATVEVVKLGGGEIGRYTFQPGWRWSEHIKPVVGGDACQTEHLGYLVSGLMGIQTADVEETRKFFGQKIEDRVAGVCIFSRRYEARRFVQHDSERWFGMSQFAIHFDMIS